MTEGRNIEQFRAPTVETTPETSIESVLERGEIERVEQLEGYFPTKAVKLKDDGQAIFRETSYDSEQSKHRFLRSKLELLAAGIDKRLRFGLVPPVVARTIEGNIGILQERIFAKVASEITNWEYSVDSSWLVKAAVFDYLIGNRDRHSGNFLIDSGTGRIWLIDHDYLSLIVGGSEKTEILDKARDKNLTQLSKDIKESLGFLLADIDSLKQETDDIEISYFIEKVKTRTQELLNTGTLA